LIFHPLNEVAPLYLLLKVCDFHLIERDRIGRERQRY